MSTEIGRCVLENKMHVIYLITNIIDGKYYVGKTCASLKRRWNDHRSLNRRTFPDGKYKSNTYLSRSMRKYGNENFIIEEIGRAPTLKTANDLERLWISCLRSFDPTVGYNSTFGGDGVRPTTETIKKQVLSRTYQRGKDHWTNRLGISLEMKEMLVKARVGKPSPVRRRDLDWSAIKKDYEQGNSSFFLAKKYSCDKGTILNILKAVGCPRRDVSTATKLGMRAAGFNV